MLWGPAMDTLEAQVECQAKKLTLTRGRERTVQDKLCTFLHGPIGRFLYMPLTKHCYDKPIKALTRHVCKCGIFFISLREHPSSISNR